MTNHSSTVSHIICFRKQYEEMKSVGVFQLHIQKLPFILDGDNFVVWKAQATIVQGTNLPKFDKGEVLFAIYFYLLNKHQLYIKNHINHLIGIEMIK